MQRGKTKLLRGGSRLAARLASGRAAAQFRGTLAINLGALNFTQNQSHINCQKVRFPLKSELYYQFLIIDKALDVKFKYSKLQL